MSPSQITASMHGTKMRRSVQAVDGSVGGSHRGQVALRGSHMERRAAVKVAGVDQDARLQVAPQQRHVAVEDAGAQLRGSFCWRHLQPAVQIL